MFMRMNEARRKRKSTSDVSDSDIQKMVIAMDMKGWEQQGDSL